MTCSPVLYVSLNPQMSCLRLFPRWCSEKPTVSWLLKKMSHIHPYHIYHTVLEWPGCVWDLLHRVKEHILVPFIQTPMQRSVCVWLWLTIPCHRCSHWTCQHYSPSPPRPQPFSVPGCWKGHRPSHILNSIPYWQILFVNIRVLRNANQLHLVWFHNIHAGWCKWKAWNEWNLQ